jgi:hypothetical protein
MDKFIGYSSVRDPNSPSAIKRRIARLRKQLSREKRIADLLRKEQILKDRLAVTKR